MAPIDPALDSADSHRCAASANDKILRSKLNKEETQPDESLEHATRLGSLCQGRRHRGAVRAIFDDHIVVYFEGFGEQRIVESQIASVHDGKVLLNVGALPEDVQAAIAKAHDAEDRIVRSRPPMP